MYRDTPDQVVDILNRLIRFYEQYRDESYNVISQNVENVTIANDVVNAIQTDITNIHGDLNSLATVAHTGDYNDLINIPPAATVNNGKLTINQNNTKIGEFTANQATDTTINIQSVNPFPVGAIYMSVNNTNPGTLFGGTWARIKDTFLLAAGDTYSAGSTGGEAKHTLTIDEMPAHTHGLPTWAAGSGQQSLANNNPEGVNHNWVATDSTGGGQAHNNMPPYLAVYVWKRTA